MMFHGLCLSSLEIEDMGFHNRDVKSQLPGIHAVYNFETNHTWDKLTS